MVCSPVYMGGGEEEIGGGHPENTRLIHARKVSRSKHVVAMHLSAFFCSSAFINKLQTFAVEEMKFF